MDQTETVPATLHVLPAPKGAPDPYIWDHVHADYRAGLTYSKLSEKYRIPIPQIVARRRVESWRRDLSPEVRAEVNARLAADSVPVGSRADEDVIGAAAAVGVEVVKRHRVALADGIMAARQVLASVKAVAEGREPEVFLLGPKETVADAMLKAANSLARLVPLERVAYGLNEREEEEPYEERLRKWKAARQGDSASSGAKRA